MENYTITDLYIAAYLKAIGFDCTIELKGKRSFFVFPLEAKIKVQELM